MRCKFTPLGFETPSIIAIDSATHFCVNLPRWGLKLFYPSTSVFYVTLCKFTPLGFETRLINLATDAQKRVNLPRWGLKLELLSYETISLFLV